MKGCFTAFFFCLCLMFSMPALCADLKNSEGAASHQINQDPESVSQYWTEERMRNAKPMSLERTEKRPDTEENAVLCTMEAKLCPDGTAVSRTGPNCTFPPCPGAVSGGAPGKPPIYRNIHDQ